MLRLQLREPAGGSYRYTPEGTSLRRFRPPDHGWQSSITLFADRHPKGYRSQKRDLQLGRQLFSAAGAEDVM